MNASDVVALLKKKGINKSESGIKYLAATYELYLPKSSPASHSGLDPKKVEDLIEVLSSPLRIAQIARDNDCPYSRVSYYLLKYRYNTIKKYGQVLLEKKEDLENVKSYL